MLPQLHGQGLFASLEPRMQQPVPYNDVYNNNAVTLAVPTIRAGIRSNNLPLNSAKASYIDRKSRRYVVHK